MSTATPLYGSAAALTITLSSLASSTTAGRESTAIDNAATDDAIDAIVGGKIKTGTTTANTKIEVWATGSYDGVSFSGGATGSDAAFTPDVGNKVMMKLLAVIPVPDTTARTYVWGPYSIAAAHGGVMPSKWGIWISHNSGVALDTAAANHEVKYRKVQYESN